MSTNHRLLAQVQSFLSKPDSESLVQKCSWEEFYATYDAIIRRFAMSIGVDNHQLDECVQDVWIALLERMERFEIQPERARFRTWLYAIVRSKAVDQFRRDKRSSPVSLNDSRQNTPIPQADSRFSPVYSVEKKTDRELIQDAVEELRTIVSPVSFQIFVLRRFDEKSARQVADEMGLSEGAVRSCQHRVEKRFRTLLKRHIEKL